MYSLAVDKKYIILLHIFNVQCHWNYIVSTSEIMITGKSVQ